VEGHADAGERGLQLMTYRRDQVGLQFVHQAQPGDVLQDGRAAEDGALVAANADDAREEEGLLVIRADADGIGKADGDVIVAALEDGLDLLGNLLGEMVVEVELLQELLGGGILEIDDAAGIEGDDGIGEGGEGDLRHLAGLEDFVAGDLAIGAKLGGHLVEGIGELAEFIDGKDRDDLVEIAVAQLAGEAVRDWMGLQDRTLEEMGEVERAGEADDHGDDHVPDGGGAEARA
jgi:hypothetical protein